MNSSTQYKLVDENTDLNIPSDYDPLLKNKFEEYIQITERTNPGIRPYFNNIPDQATRNIHVSGLVLNWSDNLSRSKLRAVLERGNIENLYLYADTVIVGTTLCFPQTNVTIYARRLIMGMCWLPSPSVAPSPHHQPSLMTGNAPPLESITGLVRSITTRTPASAAGWVAASHFVVICAR